MIVLVCRFLVVCKQGFVVVFEEGYVYVVPLACEEVYVIVLVMAVCRLGCRSI